jgi:hypothetical protein
MQRSVLYLSFCFQFSLHLFTHSSIMRNSLSVAGAACMVAIWVFAVIEGSITSWLGAYVPVATSCLAGC